MATVPLPATREMTVIAQDPSVRAKRSILMAKISVPAEDLIPGPVGYRVQIVDYDSSSRGFNGAHDLPATFSKEPARWKRGDPRLVKDYRFHAQNVYALIMKTLARFEFALGRRIGWGFKRHQIKVAPHGMLDANAFYSHQEEGLVFGYFPGHSGEHFAGSHGAHAAGVSRATSTGRSARGGRDECLHQHVGRANHGTRHAVSAQVSGA
jgi:hypothetical protein